MIEYQRINVNRMGALKNPIYIVETPSKEAGK